jgi:hypothetical protein
VAPAQPGSPTLTRFLEALVGVQTTLETAPRALDLRVTPRAEASNVPLLAASPHAALKGPSLPVFIEPGVPVPLVERSIGLSGFTTLRPGGVAVRTEELAGGLGVRASGLALEIVDPMLWEEMARATGDTSSRARLAVSDDGTPSPGTLLAVPNAAAEGVAGRSTATFSALFPFGAPAASGAPRALAAAEWAVLAAFPSTSTAAQVAAMRQAAILGGATPATPVLSGVPHGLTASAARSSEPAITSGGVPVIATELAPRARERFADPAPATVPQRQRPEMPPPLLIGAPERGPRRLPTGAPPRGSFTWPRAASFETTLPAAWTPRADAASTADSGRPTPSAPAPLVEATPRSPQAEPVAAGPAAASSQVAPFLPLLQSVGPSETVRAVVPPEPQPLVSAVARDETTQKMVEVLKTQLAAVSSSSDRVSLGDLALISLASATQQIAASPEGSGVTASPVRAAHKALAGASPTAAASLTPTPAEIDEAARRVYAELKALFDVQRWRNGNV